MGFISKLLSLFQKEGTTPSAVEKKEEYDPQLVKRLQKDHEDLVKIYEESGLLYKKDPDNFQAVSEKLHDLKIALEIHLMVEDNQLYTFLKKKYGGDEIHNRFISDIEHEMTRIAKDVLWFIRKYTNHQHYLAAREEFLKEFDEIGKMLVKRIELEEKKLYPLYAA